LNFNKNIKTFFYIYGIQCSFETIRLKLTTTPPVVVVLNLTDLFSDDSDSKAIASNDVVRQVFCDVCPAGEVVMEQSRIMRQVMVECPGFATIKFDRPSGLCSCDFGSGGTLVECLPNDGGSYTVFPGDRSNCTACLRVETDGTVIYYPQRQGDACESHYYVMRHSSDVVVETVDGIGYHYVVTRTGDNHVGT